MLSFKGTASAAATAKVSASRQPGQKKSCDLCVFRKRKCDGAMPTCGFCLSRGSECHYSLRRPNRPRGYAKRSDEDGGEITRVKVERKTASAYDSGGEESCEVGQRKDTPPLGWKRVRLSASPATGLVGTKENACLGSFFSCLGFLPLTHERLIRGTMMDILLASPSGPEVAAKGPSNPKVGNSKEGSGGNGWAGGDAASACALWCSIAMGALVQGQPTEQVSPYMHHAWTSLSQCFDTVTVESGRAFLMMAYLYNFMRDDHNFCKYLHYARGVVNRLPENTVQKQEIGDLVMMGDDTRIFHTAALEPSELEAYFNDESPALELPDVVHKSDLCRLLLHADRRMMKAFLRDHSAQAAAPPNQRKMNASYGGLTNNTTSERSGEDNQDCQDLEAFSPGGMDAEGGGQGYLSGMSINMDALSLDSTKINEDTSPSRPGDETVKYTAEARKIFARLGGAADAPEIRAGVGSLLYNSILGYLDIVTGSTELEAGFEKVKHCAEVISRYPGLCRFSTWRHLSHCLLSFLANLGDVELFEELRQAYNSVCAEDAPEVPPYAEWTMIGFCDHIFCRSMEHLGNNWGGPDGTRPFTAGDLEEQRLMSQELHWLRDDHENNIHWASVAPELHPGAAIKGQTFPTHEWTDLMPPGLAHASKVSAEQFGHMAPAPGYPPGPPQAMHCVNPVWQTGHTSGMIPGGGGNYGASAFMGARGEGLPDIDWRTSADPAGTNASWAYHGTGAVWPPSFGMAGASAGEMPASTAQHLIGARVLLNASAAGEMMFGRTTSSSTSDTGGAESSSEGPAERNADRFHWWADPASPNYTGDMSDG